MTPHRTCRNEKHGALTTGNDQQTVDTDPEMNLIMEPGSSAIAKNRHLRSYHFSGTSQTRNSMNSTVAATVGIEVTDG
jgi:hypothetical protein